MAYEIKTGDTYPPLTLTLTESTTATDTKRYPHPTQAGKWIRRVDLFTIATRPDAFKIILKLLSPATTVTMLNANIDNVEVIDSSGTAGAVEGVEPGLGVPANRGQVRGKWQAGQTAQAGEYKGEVEVTWDTATTPPAVETYPNDDAANFDVSMSPDLG